MSPSQEIRCFFEPQTVAVIGASRSPSKYGHMILSNLLDMGYPGKLYPVNPNVGEVLGLAAYPEVTQVPGEVDLAIIALPAFSVPDALQECGRKGIRSAIVIASGFNEAGEGGEDRLARLLEVATGAGIRVLGPNTTGVLNPDYPFTSSWAIMLSPRKGAVAFVAQTGMFTGPMLSWILTTEGLGVSKVVGLGNKVDVAEPEVLAYLDEDPATRVIMMYMEGVKDGRRFLEVARQVNRRKPIVLLKGGRTPAGAQAARSHTGSLANRDEVVSAALNQAGIIRVLDLEEMVDVAKALVLQFPMPGPRAGVISMSGASAVMTSDALCDFGLTVASVEDETLAQVARDTPGWAIPAHPLDLEPISEKLGRTAAYVRGLELVLGDPGVDGVVLSISAVTEEEKELIREVPPVVRRLGKPVVVHVMGALDQFTRLREGLEAGGIPVYSTQRRAARSLAGLYCRWQAVGDGSF